jgi:hypothetical protein
MTLSAFYEDHFGFRYADMDARNFLEGNFYQWRDYQLPTNETIIAFGLSKGMFASKADARRKLQNGAIRVGLNDEKTPFKKCAKLTADRPLEPNDLVRVGIRCFGIVPQRPTFLQNLRHVLFG